jgi:hypothetical protein
MKVVNLIIIALSMISLISCQGKTPRGFQRTPKALDLEDHFGTEPVQNLYGPQTRQGTVDLMREGVYPYMQEGITPITNFNQEIDPSQVVGGDFDNTAYDASKIIRPEMAVPKADIKTTFVHEAVVNTPVHLGTSHTQKMVKSMNRETGEVSEKVISSEKPIVGVLKNLREVKTDRETLININNGKIISTQKPTMMHGTR